MTTHAPADDDASQVVSLTKADLRTLIAEAVAGAGASALPPGAYYGEDGKVYRDALEPSGRVRIVKAPDGRVLRRESVARTIKRTVRLVDPTEPNGVVMALRAAKLVATNLGPDVYHPVYKDWFRGGAKRERDLPQHINDATVGAATFIEIEDDPEATIVEDHVTVSSAIVSTEPGEDTGAAENPKEAPRHELPAKAGSLQVKA